MRYDEEEKKRLVEARTKVRQEHEDREEKKGMTEEKSASI
jgi:hypothetical protein